MSEFSTVAWRLCQSVKLFFESRDVFWQDALGLGPLSLTHVAGLQEMCFSLYFFICLCSLNVWTYRPMSPAYYPLSAG
jgi:hypothetical protein